MAVDSFSFFFFQTSLLAPYQLSPFSNLFLSIWVQIQGSKKFLNMETSVLTSLFLDSLLTH